MTDKPVRRIKKKGDHEKDAQTEKTGATNSTASGNEAEPEQSWEEWRYETRIRVQGIVSGFVCLYLTYSYIRDSDTHNYWNRTRRDMSDGPCNIPRINAKDVSQEEFLQKYAHHTPVLIEGGDDNLDFRRMCQRGNLLQSWGDATVKLSSANTYSYGTKDVTLRHYIETMITPQNLNTLANETYYFFGYNDMDEWKEFFDAYRLPPYELPAHTHALSFGLAGPGSGVPFHFHGPGFAETLHGRKRWFLTPHHVQPEFNPNKTTLQWYVEDYERIVSEIDLYECTISPGEIIYFPDRWWHATLNLDTAVFISTFLSP